MRFLSLMLLLALGVGFGPSSTLRAEPRSDAAVARDLAEAENLAIRGRVDDAIRAYRALLQDGVDNPSIRYNLGTLRLQQGDVGRAVLHLRTALRGNPTFDDAKHNLELALAARVDKILPNSRDAQLGVFAWQQLPLAWVARAFFALGWLSALLLALSAWLPQPTLRTLGYRVCMVSALAAGGAGIAWYGMNEAHRRPEAVVLAAELPARMGPAADAAASFTAHAGLYGEVLSDENGFQRLRLENGLDAWFPREALANVGSLPPSGE